jgi:hypothetical protein
VSGKYVYCVVPAALPPPADLRGIDDAAVLDYAAGSLRVWFSDCDARPAATLERVRRHNAVIEEALARGVTPIPLRFGQWLASEAALVDRVGHSVERWQTLLTGLAGACELGIRARWPRPGPARDVQQPPVSGRAYLEQIARQHAGSAALRAEADRLAAALRAAVGSLVLRERVETAGGMLAIAHLVRSEEVSAYRAAVERVRSTSEAEIAVSGPWPPYSFAE